MNRRGFLKAGATLGILAVIPAKPALGKTPWGAYAEVYNASNEFVGRVGMSLVNNPDGFTMYYIFHAVRNELITSVKTRLPRHTLWMRGIKIEDWDTVSEQSFTHLVVTNGDSISFTHKITLHHA